MSCDKITFWPGHCQHSTVEKKLQESGKIILLSSPKKKVKRVSAGRDSLHTNFGVCEPKEGVTPGIKILKRESDKNRKKNKTTSAKNSPKLLPHVLPNAQDYQCVSKEAKKTLLKYIVPQRQLRTLLSALLAALSRSSQAEEEPFQLAMIGAAPFQYLTKQKGVEVFAISMRDIEYQLNKDKKTLIDPATKISECYYNFLNVFLKESFNTLSAYSKHNHVICLLSEKDYSQAALKGMSKKKLAFVKKFLEDNLKKGFIEASNAPCSLPIMLAVKLEDGI